MVELRNIVEGEAGGEVSKSFLETSRARPVILCDVRRRIRSVFQLLAQSEDELRKRQALSGISMRVH